MPDPRYIPISRRKTLWACPCVTCGRQDDIEIDHVVAVIAGGDSRPCNLQPLCRTCNLLKRRLGTNSAVISWIASNRVEFELRQNRRTRRLALIAHREFF